MTAPLILPAETQIREFDGKLLVACFAAERRIRSIVGSRTAIHANAAILPRGIYISKDVRSSSLKMLKILSQLGHRICAWDEECLVYFSPQYYYESRVSPEAFPMAEILFAWGPENARIFTENPHYQGAEIHITGNPRIDLLRPELRGFFNDEVRDIRKRFGNYILVNTHFGAINHYIPKLGQHTLEAITPLSEKRGDFKQGLADHLYSIFQHFEQVIPALGRAFPDLKVLVRPHPAENRAPWDRIAANQPNIQVVQEGNVIPWIIGSQVLIHNSCTTSIEAFALEKPAIAFLPVTSERFDLHFPNSLGYKAFSSEELIGRVRSLTSSSSSYTRAPEQLELLEQYISALDGPLAAERIVDVLEQEKNFLKPNLPKQTDRLIGGFKARKRKASKWAKSFLPNHKNSAHYQQQRFPDLTEVQVQAKIRRFNEQLGRFGDVTAHKIRQNIFEITHH